MKLDNAKIKVQKELKLLKKELERNILINYDKYLPLPKKGRFELIRQHSDYFPVREMCRILCVSKSGYYKGLVRTPSKKRTT